MRKLKSVKLFILFFLLISCGYAPLYKDLSNTDFSIQIVKINGDRNLNNLFKSNLINYDSKNSEKNYDIDINTRYIKSIIAKDTTGAATEYKLTVNAFF